MEHPDGTPDVFKQDSVHPVIARLEMKARLDNPSLVRDAEFGGVEPNGKQIRSGTGSAGSDTVSDSEGSDKDGDNEESRAEKLSEDSEDEDDESDSQAGSVALDDDAAHVSKSLAPTDLTVAEDTEMGEASKEGEAGESTKPKSKSRKSRPRSPSPPLKVARVQPSISLTFKIPEAVPKGGFIFDVKKAAAKQGMWLPSEDEVSEVEETPEGQAATKSKLSESTSALLGGKKAMPLPPKQKRRVQDRDEGYDKEDPFVDDSELHLDLVKVSAIPQREGFFVWPGRLPVKSEAELRAESTKSTKRRRTKSDAPVDSEPAKKKAKSTAKTAKPSTSKSTALTSTAVSTANVASPGSITRNKSVAAGGTARSSSVVALNGAETGASKTPKSSKSATKASGSNKIFSNELQLELNSFKALAAKESFVPKKIFPEVLKEPLFDLAMTAVHLGEYDDDFFLVLTDKILPYNKFTITKLVKTNIYDRRVQEMQSRINQLMEDMKAAIERQMEPSKTAYSAALTKYEKEHAVWLAEQSPGFASQPKPKSVDGVGEDSDIQELQEGEPPRPKQRFVWNDELRQMFYEILTLDNALVTLQTEKFTLDKNPEKPLTEMTARKRIYSRISALWPEGWLSTRDLSNQWTIVRKKYGGA